MIKKTTSNHYIFSSLQKFEGLVHAVSTIALGDMNTGKAKNLENITSYAKELGVRMDKMIFMEQKHTKIVKEVRLVRQFEYKRADGLVTDKNVVLNTKTADCVPLIFFDPVTKTIAIAHSGWLGTHKNITENVIKKLEKKKVNIKDLIVCIGPAIGICCYDIDNNRAKKFKTKYNETYRRFLVVKDGKYYLDLVELVKIQLKKLGVKSQNIEDAGICTRHSEDFFSFRKQTDMGNTKVFLTSVGLK